jgi:hypothetical protein
MPAGYAGRVADNSGADAPDEGDRTLPLGEPPSVAMFAPDPEIDELPSAEATVLAEDDLTRE